jgi:hypothetical protein
MLSLAITEQHAYLANGRFTRLLPVCRAPQFMEEFQHKAFEGEDADVEPLAMYGYS